MALQGPYDLSSIALCVEPSTIGVYALSCDGRCVHYVGRSDSDLPARIRKSADGGAAYQCFWFDYASSPMQAYRYECELFHHFCPPHNTVHPAVPPGTNWRCPVAGCPWS